MTARALGEGLGAMLRAARRLDWIVGVVVLLAVMWWWSAFFGMLP